MNSNVRKKVLLELFGSPLFVLLCTLASSMLVISWAIGGSVGMNLIACCLLLISVFSLILKFTTEGRSIIERQEDFETEETKRARIDFLNSLDRRLAKDKDPRTQKCLRKIRLLEKQLEEEFDNKDSSKMEHRIFKSGKQVIDQCIENLKDAQKLHSSAKSFSGVNKKKLLIEREELVASAVKTCQDFAKQLRQYHIDQKGTGAEQLSKLKDKLDRELEFAKKADSMPSYSEDEAFERFLEE